MIDLALMRPDPDRRVYPVGPAPFNDVEAPTCRRFLTEEDCTWLEDPEDPRYGQVHHEQWAAVVAICAGIGVQDAVREFLLLTGRQAAKTTTELLAAIKTATEVPGSRTLYVSFDLATGAELIYEPAQFWLRRLGWGFKATSNGPTGLRIRLENGSIIQCRSADDLRAVGKLRGRGWHLILGDELQDMLHVAEQLFSTVLGPTQLRYRGAMCLAFTPPDVQSGWLWEEYASGRWRLLGWGMDKNPFLPPGEVERFLRQRGLTMDSPIARREIRGLWEPNTEIQVFSGFSYLINVYDPGVATPEEYAVLPAEMPKDKWVYGFGSDLGWEHDTSIVFLAWNLHDPQKRIWEVFSWKKNHQTLEDICAVLLPLHHRFRPWRPCVMDQAGAGGQIVLKSVEEKFRAMGLPIVIKYKPANVQASVGLVNDHFRTGRLFLRKDSLLLEEIPKTVWKKGTNRQEISKSPFDPHGLDGLRYGVWAATNFRAIDPVVIDPRRPTDPQAAAAYDREMAWRKENAKRKRIQAKPF